MDVFYRWGWISLVAGCAFIAMVLIVGTELALKAAGLEVASETVRFVYFVRAVITAGFLAAFSGWFVLRARRRFDEAREHLRKQESILREQTLRAEQLAGLGAISRILAHEVRNPLNSIALHTTILERSVGACSDQCAATARNALDVLREESMRLDKLVQDYLDYARGTEAAPVTEPVRLEEIAGRVLEAQERAMQERRISLDVAREGGLPTLHGDPARLTQAFQSLVTQALLAVKDGGRIAVRLARDDGHAVLSIEDDGPGFEDPAAVFRPFFSPRAGAPGLSLAVVRDVARAHGGEVSAENVSGGGARVTMRLPVVRA